MELEILPELLGLDGIETELFVGFLGFTAENLPRVSHLARMEPDLVTELVERLVRKGLVDVSAQQEERCYELAATEKLLSMAAAARRLDEDEQARLQREGEIVAEVRELSKLRFVNVIARRERVPGPSFPIESAEFMRLYYPYVDLRLGTRCNFNCLYCLLGHEKKFMRTDEEIDKDLQLGRRSGLKKVALTGGEPTLHPRLLAIVRRARDLGYEKIILVTNASLLSNEKLIDKFVERGIDTFGISFDVADREISERLWRRAAYDEVVRGIENLLSRGGLLVGVIAVINKLNYSHLPGLAGFLADIPRHPETMLFANLDFVMPEENAWLYREEVVPSLSEVAPFVREAQAEARRRGLTMTYRGIPTCVMGTEFLEFDLDRYMTIFQVHGAGEQTRFNRASLDLFRTKPRSCRRCRYDRICNGVYRGYAHLNGVDELQPIPIEDG